MTKLLAGLLFTPLVISSCSTPTENIFFESYYWGQFDHEMVRVKVWYSSSNYNIAKVNKIEFDKTLLHIDDVPTNKEIIDHPIDKTVAKTEFDRKLSVYKFTAPANEDVCIVKDYPIDLTDKYKSKTMLLAGVTGETIDNVGLSNQTLTLDKVTCLGNDLNGTWLDKGTSTEIITEKSRLVDEKVLDLKDVKAFYTGTSLPDTTNYQQFEISNTHAIGYEVTGSINNSKRETIGRDFEQLIGNTTSSKRSWKNSIDALEKEFTGRSLENVLTGKFYSSSAFDKNPGWGSIDITGSTLATTSSYILIAKETIKEIKNKK